MVRTAAQCSWIAAIYEIAARDSTLPPQPRAAFAKKASWFRMLAQIEVIKAGAALAATSKPVAKKTECSQIRSGRGKEDGDQRRSPTFDERSSCASAVMGVKPIGFLTKTY